MNKDVSVITVPAAPPEKTSYGFLTLVLLAYMLGNKFDANKYLYLNTMHSYKDKQGAAKQLLHDMESLNIKMDGVLYDSDFLGQFEKDLLLLKQKGYIKVKEANKLLCPCGKVDCLDLPDLQYNFAKSVDGKKVCSFCGVPCESITEKSLVFKFPELSESEQIKIVPAKFGKKVSEIYSRLQNSEMLISKHRNTGVPYEIDGQSFNIDIDFVLFNFLSNINTDKRIIVGTSHVIYHMLMMHVMDHIKNKDKENIFITMPYIQGQCQIPEIPNIESYKKHIYMLGAITKSNDSQFNKSLFQLITKDRKENYLRTMYSILMQQYNMDTNASFFDNVNAFYMNDFNMNNISKSVSAKLQYDKAQRQKNRALLENTNTIKK